MLQGFTGDAGDGPQVVLVVDDEPLVRMIAADGLRDDGCVVYEAASADEALDVIGAHDHVDCLVTDIDMPGMSGVELAHEVRRRRPGVACLLTSGRGAPPESFCRFLAKPYSVANLVEEVRLAGGRNVVDA